MAAEEIRLLAVLHRVQVVGEAARRIPESVRMLSPEIPWARMVGIRNFVVHAYDRLDLGVVHDVVTVKLPQLVPLLEHLRDEVLSRGDAPLT